MTMAYISSDNEAHYICSKCPDSEATKKAYESIETKREIDALIHMRDVLKRRVVMTLCDPCIDRIENTISDTTK